MEAWPDWLWAVLVAPIVGSLLGVLAIRLPQGRPVVLARSACDTCHATLRPRELIPLLSYALQRGACRHCGAAIGLFSPAMELGAVAMALWAATLFPGGEVLWASCLLGWMLLAVAAADITSFRLPDALTLPLLMLGLGETAWLWPPALLDHALAALCAYGSFRLVAWLYRRLRGRDGLGAGDAKLLAAAGAWLGLADLPLVVFGAAASGLLLAAVWAWWRGWTPGQRLPFGPCLALATWLTWLYG